MWQFTCTAQAAPDVLKLILIMIILLRSTEILKIKKIFTISEWVFPTFNNWKQRYFFITLLPRWGFDILLLKINSPVCLAKKKEGNNTISRTKTHVWFSAELFLEMIFLVECWKRLILQEGVPRLVFFISVAHRARMQRVSQNFERLWKLIHKSSFTSTH